MTGQDDSHAQRRDNPRDDDPEALAQLMSDIGAVAWGSPTSGPAGLATVAVPGGLAVVDPARPDAGAFGFSDDPAAGRMLAELLGGNRHDPAGGSPRRVVADQLARLAMTRWLAEWSPEPMSRRLLDWEHASLALGLTDVIGDDEAAHAAMILDRDAELLMDLAEGESGAGSRATPLNDLVRSALDAWSGEADLTDPRLRRLARLPRPLAIELPVVAADISAAWRRERAELPVDALVRAAGLPGRAATDGSSAEGIDSVDWRLVPTDILDSAEGTVRWRIGPGHKGALALSVEVARAPEAMPRLDPYGPGVTGGIALLARARLEPGPDLPDVVLLPEQGSYRGAVTLPEWALGPLASGSDLAVDVLAPNTAATPRYGAARIHGRAQRWAVRAVTRLRLGSSGILLDDADPVESARRALIRAMADLREVEASDPGDLGHLARRQRIALLGLDVVCLRLLGRATDAAETESLLVGEPLGAKDRDTPQVPDVREPGWHLTGAERALLVPSDR